MASISGKRHPSQGLSIPRAIQPNEKPFETKADAQAWLRMIESEIDRGILVSRVEAERFLNRLDWYLINTQAFFVQVGRITFFL